MPFPTGLLLGQPLAGQIKWRQFIRSTPIHEDEIESVRFSSTQIF